MITFLKHMCLIDPPVREEVRKTFWADIQSLKLIRNRLLGLSSIILSFGKHAESLSLYFTHASCSLSSKMPSLSSPTNDDGDKQMSVGLETCSIIQTMKCKEQMGKYFCDITHRFLRGGVKGNCMGFIIIEELTPLNRRLIQRLLNEQPRQLVGRHQFYLSYYKLVISAYNAN